MKKQYLPPCAKCLPMETQSAILNNASFDGVGLDSATEVVWTDGALVDFPEIL